MLRPWLIGTGLRNSDITIQGVGSICISVGTLGGQDTEEHKGARTIIPSIAVDYEIYELRRV